MQLAKKHHWTSTSLAHSSQFCFCVALESVANQHNSTAVTKYLDYESPKQDQETQSPCVPLDVCKLPPPPSTGLVLLMFRSGSLKGSQRSCWMIMNVSFNYQREECAEGLGKVVLREDEGWGALTLHGDAVVDLIITHGTHKVVVLHHDVRQLKHTPVPLTYT